MHVNIVIYVYLNKYHEFTVTITSPKYDKNKVWHFKYLGIELMKILYKLFNLIPKNHLYEFLKFRNIGCQGHTTAYNYLFLNLDMNNVWVL